MKRFLGYLIIALVFIGGLTAILPDSVQASLPIQQTPKRTYVRAAHILVNSEAQALRIKKDIESGKITFQEAAKKYSSCPSGQQGGDLGYFTRNQMVKEFENASFTLPIGKVSAPVKTQFGYHLIFVIDAK